MSYHRRLAPEYYRKSLDVLETSLNLHAYRSWRAFDPGTEHPIDLRYAAMPALTKRDIREHSPRGFVPTGIDIQRGLDSGEIQMVATSGSSDISVTNIWNQKWWDASEKASWKLNSHASRLATGDHAEAILANPRNVGIISDGADLPFERRRLARFLYLNEKTDPSRWAPELMDRMIHEMDAFKPAVLEANPSLLARLCRYAAESRKEVFQPGLIVFTYEYPSRWHYRQIRRVFSSPTASSYGTTESGYVFMQCEEGKFHQNSEFCRVDFQPLKSEHGGPQLGRILVTTFNNPWYYMVRLDVGDLARLDEEDRCPCGRDSGFIASAIEGRFTNATLTCEGRLVTLRRLDDALDALVDIDEYRLEQTSPGAYVLHLASRRKDRDKLSAEAAEILRRLYGNEAEISVVYEEALSPEDSGKYCLAKTLFPLEIEPFLDTGNVSR
jgi:phenylacetate-coenzyme A ligase PaaK-like adenylate-forming protein